MQVQNNLRNKRFEAIRHSLQQNPVMKTNTLMIQNKLEKRRKRRQSVQLDQNLTQSQRNLLLEVDNDLSVKTMVKFYQKYNMGAKIGEGSDGFVKKCELKLTGQIFAVKSMKMDEQDILFLKNNFKQIHALNHPHIVKYRNMYLDMKNKTAYLVMDYLNFPNLLGHKNLSQQEIQVIIQQLLDTVSYMHSKNICHRDIKPQNILFDRERSSIKLVDFGISKNIETRGKKRQLLTITGTLYYRAPEMFSGGGYDEKVDVWAVGITLFQLITGRTPFQSDYLTETIQNIEKGQIVFDEQIWGRYSKSAKDLVMRLLKKRQERPTAQEAKKHFWFIKKSTFPDEANLFKSEKLEFRFGQMSAKNAITSRKFVQDGDKSRLKVKIPELKKNLMKKLDYDQSSDSDTLIQIESQGEKQTESPHRSSPSSKSETQAMTLKLNLAQSTQIQPLTL